MKCSHLYACTYGHDNLGRKIWWCGRCGALSVTDRKKGRPRGVDWQYPSGVVSIKQIREWK